MGRKKKELYGPKKKEERVSLEEKINALLECEDIELIETSTKISNGKPIGMWKADVKRAYRLGKLSDEQIEKLEEHGMSWSEYSTPLLNARAIQEWIKAHDGVNIPSISSTDMEEVRLGNAYKNIKKHIISPYMKLETDQEREEFRKSHKDFDEIMQIMSEIESNKVPLKLQQVRAAKRWIIELGHEKMPSEGSKDKEERKIGRTLSEIKDFLIMPYMMLETEEEKREFRENHPELDEILEIISEINLKYGNKNKRKLAELIILDLETRKKLEEAKKQEAECEKDINKTKE